MVTSDRGDVVELLDSSGAFAAYRYDAWGRTHSIRVFGEFMRKDRSFGISSSWLKRARREGRIS